MLIVTKNGDDYYTGPLPEAKVLLARDYDIVVVIEAGYVSVRFFNHDSDPGDFDVWGNAPTEDEAWRYALGAEFGSPDKMWDAEDDEYLGRLLDGGSR